MNVKGYYQLLYDRWMWKGTICSSMIDECERVLSASLCNSTYNPFHLNSSKCTLTGKNVRFYMLNSHDVTRRSLHPLTLAYFVLYPCPHVFVCLATCATFHWFIRYAYLKLGVSASCQLNYESGKNYGPAKTLISR